LTQRDFFPSSQEAPAKPTKSAQKKATRTARIEKRQLRKAANPKGLGSQTTSSSDNDAVDALHGSAQNPVAISDEAATLGNANMLQDPVPDTSSHTPQTDIIHQAADREPSTHILLPEYPTSAPNDPGPHHKLPAPRPSPDRDVELAMQRKAEREVESTKKRQNVLTRTLWTFIMIGGFICALALPCLPNYDANLNRYIRLSPLGSCVSSLASPALPDTCLPGSHCPVLAQICHSRRWGNQGAGQGSVEQDPQLVLFRGHKLFFIRGEHHLLLQSLSRPCLLSVCCVRY
jgi:hypothetical protein